MKKVLAVLMALVLCLGVTMCAYAEQAEEVIDNEAASISETAEATQELEAADAAGDASKAGGSHVGDLIRFIPAYLEVSSNKVTVYGFFINLNSDCAVGGFRNYKMDIYEGSQLLISGTFGTINNFTIEPYGMKYQSFTYNGKHRLNAGTYVCDDRTYSVCSYNFYTYSR